MSCKWMISHVLPMNNPTQMLPCKSLNAAGKWAFLPHLTEPQRWSRRLSHCNSTSCSVPGKPSLKHFSHDLGIQKEKQTSRSLSFLPICVKISLASEIHENEKQKDSKRGGMLLTMPVDYWQLAKSHQKGWGRNRSLCITWKNKSCSTLYSLLYRPPRHASSHLFSLRGRATPRELTLQSLCWWGSLDLWHVWKHQ